MSDVITKKRRGIHKRIRRKVILVVTDNNISENDVYREFHLNHEEIALRIIKSNLTGKSLDLAIKRYMQDHQIFTTRGDRVLCLIKNQKGGDAYS